MTINVIFKKKFVIAWKTFHNKIINEKKQDKTQLIQYDPKSITERERAVEERHIVNEKFMF